MRVLCVAEKPSISKAVAGHLSGGSHQTHNTRSQYIKNYSFDFDFGSQWGNCSVTMTCVTGHLTNVEFTPEYKNWSHPPPESLFRAPVVTSVHDDKKQIAKNLESQARYARLLVIWTDCDREGEHIGQEIVTAAQAGNPTIQVKRARFSNIERAHVLSAARSLANLDEKQVDAVSTRIELDLRIGYAFTRFITNSLRPLGGPMENLTLSYGSCQFPTLGFVVDRYFRVKNFVPEPFWSIKMMHNRDSKKINFNWQRNHLFDRMSTVILYERCLSAKTATVSKVQEKPTRKFKPLPLTTVELQKAATSLLRMTGQQAMTIAEGLYNRGFISYPRTETDRFDKGMNLRALVQKQTTDQRWGQYSQALVNGAFQQPREGRHDDKAHPPIHPITHASPSVLTFDEGRLYEYVVRRFLACCSDDAKGMATDVDLEYGEEIFSAHGVIVLERNYLDVFIYETWNNSVELPKFTMGERFEPTEAVMTEGKTSPPGYLTEADLIALMDANGIGTDATMAEHIQKIQDREYVATIDRSGQASTGDEEPGDAPPARGGRGRGGRGGRGSRGRGGASSAGSRRGVKVFVPTQLGVALILGFDRMNFETSLGKPFLRKEMELKMKAICEGRTSKEVVLRESIAQYRHVFMQTQEKLDVLRAACREFVFARPGS
ncbi:DNA topoisomerase [Ilyonectria robusta]|uniref:DNA topoisomerase n=1 Tax=Ilyonectria robusta TaxID=1079257 RepID=UPI001E8E10C1|nr:DNA topoisomerase [Ilyonectria robusta]KAH6998765.1 DNA topoisomerase [Ilyonectria sp. MPI-CAGE-AT-0026]KAH8738000.1 DNA topoisomerase [Ilyonectria robusta]